MYFTFHGISEPTFMSHVFEQMTFDDNPYVGYNQVKRKIQQQSNSIIITRSFYSIQYIWCHAH